MPIWCWAASLRRCLGEVPLNLERARQAIHDHVAVPLGLDLYEAAAGIVQIVNNNMVGALRVVSLERGTIRSGALW